MEKVLEYDTAVFLSTASPHKFGWHIDSGEAPLRQENQAGELEGAS